jgi:hypothetical protein
MAPSLSKSPVARASGVAPTLMTWPAARAPAPPFSMATTLLVESLETRTSMSPSMSKSAAMTSWDWLPGVV